MVAQEVPSSLETAPAEGPGLYVVPLATGDGDVAAIDRDGAIRQAERSMLRAAVRGVLLGMAAGAVVWVGLVALALATVGGSYDVVAWLGMAAVVGAFAGSFLGGWAGVTATADHMDEVANRRGG